MNNSDYNDFKNWQNGDDENDMRNPNNGFYYFQGPFGPNFQNMWKKMNNNEDYTDNLRDYFHMDDILKEWAKQINSQQNPNKTPRRPHKQPKSKVMTFTQDEYLKLIEIRGYLAITEQFAHVKALDKLINQIKIIPVNPKDSK